MLIVLIFLRDDVINGLSKSIYRWISGQPMSIQRGLSIETEEGYAKCIMRDLGNVQHVFL